MPNANEGESDIEHRFTVSDCEPRCYVGSPRSDEPTPTRSKGRRSMTEVDASSDGILTRASRDGMLAAPPRRATQLISVAFFKFE